MSGPVPCLKRAARNSSGRQKSPVEPVGRTGDLTGFDTLKMANKLPLIIHKSYTFNHNQHLRSCLLTLVVGR
ncbi:hypothetical protein QVD17_28037 [Tagetes erecta]|uniref:Uncharacterized protein n=1 Tax=Tagetes erecta TaxID=13708 RepID=A0AAD8KEC1_TARER|nr:hypothetical protein QVD17_28037 [Tagetes erecta]